MAISLNFTKQSLADIPIPDKRVYYRDTNAKSPRGFGLYATPAGAKCFFLSRTVAGRTKRLPIGQFPDMQLPQARREAERIATVAGGIDPVKARKAENARNVTLIQATDDYFAARGGNLKDSTQANYRRAVELHLASWKDRPLGQITREMVEVRHRQMSKSSPAAADNTMRALRAIFNFAAGKYEDEKGRPLFTDNPTRRLSDNRAWHKQVRRQNIIRPRDFPKWRQGVEEARLRGEFQDMASDYLLFVLFSGLRRREAASLRWEQVDLEHETVRILDTKNGKPLTLPLSTQLKGVLVNRRMSRISQWVFPGKQHDRPIAEPKGHVRRVAEISGVDFTIHDLRRTFITVAESLDISKMAIQTLVNHSGSGMDVTDGYVIMDESRLREPMEKVAQRMVDFMGV